MKENLTRIAVILDRSGSMQSVRSSTIAGFNEFIDQQKMVPGEATVKLVQFDDQYEVVFDKPLQQAPKLTDSTFVPRGWTALLDAQGKTIVSLGEELAALPEDQRPSKVIVMTLTDGMENRSTEYTAKRVAEMIKEQTEKYGWQFVFLGANQDAVKTAAAINIPASNAMTYAANDVATCNTMMSTSRLVRQMRSGLKAEYTEEDRLKAMVEK